MFVFLLNKEYSNRKQAFIKQQRILEQNFQDIDLVLLEKIIFFFLLRLLSFISLISIKQYKTKLDDADREQ